MPICKYARRKDFQVQYFRHIYQGRRLILLSVLRWSARNEQQVVEELVLIPVVRNERLVVEACILIMQGSPGPVRCISMLVLAPT